MSAPMEAAKLKIPESLFAIDSKTTSPIMNTAENDPGVISLKKRQAKLKVLHKFEDDFIEKLQQSIIQPQKTAELSAIRDDEQCAERRGTLKVLPTFTGRPLLPPPKPPKVACNGPLHSTQANRMRPIQTYEYVGVSRGVDRPALDPEEVERTEQRNEEWTEERTKERTEERTEDQNKERIWERIEEQTEDDNEDAISWSFDDDTTAGPSVRRGPSIRRGPSVRREPTFRGGGLMKLARRFRNLVRKRVKPYTATKGRK